MLFFLDEIRIPFVIRTEIVWFTSYFLFNSHSPLPQDPMLVDEELAVPSTPLLLEELAHGRLQTGGPCSIWTPRPPCQKKLRSMVFVGVVYPLHHLQLFFLSIFGSCCQVFKARRRQRVVLFSPFSFFFCGRSSLFPPLHNRYFPVADPCLLYPPFPSII